MQLDTVSLNDRQWPSPLINLGNNAWHIIQMTNMDLTSYTFPLQTDGFRPSEPQFYYPVGTQLMAIATWNANLSSADMTANYNAISALLP